MRFLLFLVILFLAAIFLCSGGSLAQACVVGIVPFLFLLTLLWHAAGQVTPARPAARPEDDQAQWSYWHPEVLEEDENLSMGVFPEGPGIMDEEDGDGA